MGTFLCMRRKGCRGKRVRARRRAALLPPLLQLLVLPLLRLDQPLPLLHLQLLLLLLLPPPRVLLLSLRGSVR